MTSSDDTILLESKPTEGMVVDLLRLVETSASCSAE
jgi:hypothetical protein